LSLKQKMEKLNLNYDAQDIYIHLKLMILQKLIRSKALSQVVIAKFSFLGIKKIDLSQKAKKEERKEARREGKTKKR